MDSPSKNIGVGWHFLKFSFWQLLVFRNETDFCILILYPVTLPNSLMRSSIFFFFVVYLGFSLYSIVLSAKTDNFTSSFPVWISYIFFSFFFFWFECVAQTFNTTLNKSGKIGHPCLVPDLRGSFQLFIIEYDVSWELIIYGLYYVIFPLYPLESFCHKWILNFVKSFSASLGIIIWFLFFNLLMWCIPLIDLQILNHPCIPGKSLTLSWCMIFLNICWL